LLFFLFLARAQIDEVLDVGASSLKQEAVAAAAIAEGADAPPPITNMYGKHVYKVFLSDGRSRAVGLDVCGVLAAAYHAAQRGRSAAQAEDVAAFFAGSKVCTVLYA
jgi:hypothetical protein